MAALTLSSVVFWFALSVLAYVYLGYPLLAWAVRRARPRPVARSPIEPYVTVVVVAYNEAHRIDGASKIC